MEDICKIKDVLLAIYSFENTFSRESGITLNEALILCKLKDGKAYSAAEIAGFIGLTASRVSRIIASFEEKGMLSREIGHSDKRQMFFALTKLGEEHIIEMQRQQSSIKILCEKIQEILQ